MSRRSEKNLANADNLAKQIIELGQNKEFAQLQQLIGKCDTKLVCYRNFTTAVSFCVFFSFFFSHLSFIFTSMFHVFFLFEFDFLA